LVVRKTVEPVDEAIDLGELSLAKRATLHIEFIATSSTDFSSVPKKDRELAAGAGWVPRDGDPIALTVEQTGSQLTFSSRFSEARVVDLGKKPLRAKKLALTADDMPLPAEVKVVTGHLYVAHYPPDGWVLLRIKRIVR
jgi:hypothetical protein